STSSGQAPSTSSAQAPATGPGQAPSTSSGSARLNLLDLLDELRELAEVDQERRLRKLPAEAQEKLRQWLKAADAPADALDLHGNALAGADPALLSRLRNDLSQFSPGQSSRRSETAPLEQGADSALQGNPSASPRLSFQAGDILLKQYRIVCQLGSGGMGEVFRAIDENAGEQ